MLNAQQEFMLTVSVEHAKQCADFMALPRVSERRTKYGTVTRCKHCGASLWTADELRKVIRVRKERT